MQLSQTHEQTCKTVQKSLPAKRLRCNPSTPKNRSLWGKMTVTRISAVLSGGFVILLLWGCTRVACLVNDGITVPPVMTKGYHSTAKACSDTTGNTVLAFDCKDSELCTNWCSFCHQHFPGFKMDCLSFILDHLCLSTFHNAMSSKNSTDWCIWGNVNSLYSNLSSCTENKSDCLKIPWPNPLVEQIFVAIHSTYFKECPTEEFSDPPPAVIFALVITPICLIPVMVSLVVLKTKNGDGNS